MAISNVVELRKVVTDQETASLHDVAKAIGIKLRLADQNDNDAANHRREAGEMLVTLRARIEADNQSWKQFVYDYFDRPPAELEKLMRYVAACKSVQAAIEAKPELAGMSDRVVGREVGVHHETVAAARKAVGEKSPTENSCSNSKTMVERRTGKDGKQYKATKPQAQIKQQQPSSTLIEQSMRLVAKMTAAERQTFFSRLKETYK
ncbi:hypothetical protein [Bradyrhizobium sp. S3.7.6]